MGQMQLLLIVLGVMLVGIAILVGISMFHANEIESTRNAMINDLGYYSQRARTYYTKSSTLGGGNRSFLGISLSNISSMTENINARYYLESATADECAIVGVGKVISGDDSIRIRITEERNVIEMIN
ncbi:MAG TPA: hypothetical protein DCP63_04915 [Bacteroidetes bacterium]|nr:hypothetical protein [Bacteroidota bacterium]